MMDAWAVRGWGMRRRGLDGPLVWRGRGGERGHAGSSLLALLRLGDVDVDVLAKSGAWLHKEACMKWFPSPL